MRALREGGVFFSNKPTIRQSDTNACVFDIISRFFYMVKNEADNVS